MDFITSLLGEKPGYTWTGPPGTACLPAGSSVGSVCGTAGLWATLTRVVVDLSATS